MKFDATIIWGVVVAVSLALFGFLLKWIWKTSDTDIKITERVIALEHNNNKNECNAFNNMTRIQGLEAAVKDLVITTEGLAIKHDSVLDKMQTLIDVLKK